MCFILLNLFLQRFFSHKEQKDDIQHGLNHNKYMVTDNAVYIGKKVFMVNFYLHLQIFEAFRSILMRLILSLVKTYIC